MTIAAVWISMFYQTNNNQKVTLFSCTHLTGYHLSPFPSICHSIIIVSLSHLLSILFKGFDKIFLIPYSISLNLTERTKIIRGILHYSHLQVVYWVLQSRWVQKAILLMWSSRLIRAKPLNLVINLEIYTKTSVGVTFVSMIRLQGLKSSSKSFSQWIPL